MDIYLGRRSVVQTLLPPVKKGAPGGSMPSNVGSVLLRYVGFCVTGRYYYFEGGLSLP